MTHISLSEIFRHFRNKNFKVVKEKFHHHISPPLEISQNSQENTCVRISCLIKLQASEREGCFYVHVFAKPRSSLNRIP